MTVAAAIEIRPGGRSETGLGQVQAGAPAKVQSTPGTGSIGSSSPAVRAQSFQSSWQSVLATMDAGVSSAIEEDAGKAGTGAENSPQLEAQPWMAPGTGSTLGSGGTPASPATRTQWTHSTISQQGSTSAGAPARISGSKPATSLVPADGVEHDVTIASKARREETVHPARNDRTEAGRQAEHAAAALAPEPMAVLPGIASLSLPMPIIVRPEASAQPPDESGSASAVNPVSAFDESDVPARQTGTSGIGSASTPGPTATASDAPPDSPAISQLHRSAADSVPLAAPLSAAADDARVAAPETPRGNTAHRTEVSSGLISIAPGAGSTPESIPSTHTSPYSAGAGSSQSTMQSPGSASSGSATGPVLDGTDPKEALRQAPVQTPAQTPVPTSEQDNTASQVPNRARSETAEVQPSSGPSVSSQFRDPQPEVAQSHTMHPAQHVAAGMVPAASDSKQPAPILAKNNGSQTIGFNLPAAKPENAGNSRNPVETPSRPAHWTNGVERASQAPSLHTAQPGVPALDRPGGSMVAPARDQAAIGETAGAGSQLRAPASSNSEAGTPLGWTVSNHALKQGPLQTQEQNSTPSQIPNRARSEAGEILPSIQPNISSQRSDSQPETAQSPTMHSAPPLPAGVVPAMANFNPAPVSATLDPMQAAPILGIEPGAQAIEPNLPVAKPGSVGDLRTSVEAPSRPTRWAKGVVGASQGGSVHPGQPGVPAQDGPVVAPVRDPAGFAGTTGAGTQFPASTTNGGGSANDAFAAIDEGTANSSHTWVHAGAQRAEAGFEDPDLGWIGVRADTSGGGIHAALIPGSADASQALGGHLAGLNTYLADRHTPVDTLTVAEFDSRSSGSGPGQQGGETMQHGAGRGDGQSAYSEAQSGIRISPPGIAATVSSDPSPQAAGSDSIYDTQRPGSMHISVMA